MERKILPLVVLLLIKSFALFAQDTPPPAANLELIPSDSYIIPLDFEKQSRNYTYDPGGGGAINFDAINLAAYGLAYELLSQGVELKWVIRSGKNKDEDDFMAEVERIFPSALAIQPEPFYSSAFIVGQEPETCNPNLPGGSLSIDNIISNFANDVAVYRLINDETLDVRYTLAAPPRITILDDSGLETVFTQILDTARIDGYSIQSNNDFLAVPECNTIVCQPHIDGFLVDQAYVNVVEDFVVAGGNLFVQCVGVVSFEDEGFFQTTSGINTQNWLSGTNYVYHNPDMPVMQFQGSLTSGIEGLMGTYSLNPGSNFEPFAYQQVTLGPPVDGEYLSTAADLNGADVGGNMIYLGGHEYSLPDVFGNDPGADPAEIYQSKRLFLNSLFIPSKINYACAGFDLCICPGDSIQLGCPEVSTDLDFTWTPAIGLSCTDCPRPMASPSSTTTYTMSTVDGDCGASSVTVSILEAPTYDSIVYDCDAQDQNYTVSFNVNSASNLYIVSGTPGFLAGTVFTSVAIPTGDPFSITFSDDGGCEVIVDGIYSCDCIASAVLSGGGAICENSGESIDIQIDLLGNGPWELEYAIDGLPQPIVSTNDNPYILSVTDPGEFSLVSVFDDLCPGSVSGVAQVSAVLMADASIDPVPLLCEFDDPESITTIQSGGTLSGPGVQNNSFDPLVAGPGIHTISYSIPGSCGDIQSIDIEVLTIREIGILSAIPPCLGDTAKLSAIYDESEVDLAVWNVPSSSDTILVTQSGVYTLTLSNEACIREQSSTVIFTECTEDCILIGPNAFTPDGDGVNDTFSADSDCIFDDYLFRVYNRWGEKLFETNDPEGSWDGTYHDKDLNNGVFVWTARGWTTDGFSRVKKSAKGNVTLIR